MEEQNLWTAWPSFNDPKPSTTCNWQVHIITSPQIGSAPQIGIQSTNLVPPLLKTLKTLQNTDSLATMSEDFDKEKHNHQTAAKTAKGVKRKWKDHKVVSGDSLELSKPKLVKYCTTCQSILLYELYAKVSVLWDFHTNAYKEVDNYHEFQSILSKISTSQECTLEAHFIQLLRWIHHYGSLNSR